MSVLLDALSWAFLVTGALCCVIGGIGMLRMPDFYTRIHAASVSDAVGAGLILLGLILQAGLTLVMAKLVIVGLLIFFTSPAATHALARAALGRRLEPLLGEEAKPWKR